MLWKGAKSIPTKDIRKKYWKSWISGYFQGVFREFQRIFRAFSGCFPLCPFRVCRLDPSRCCLEMSHRHFFGNGPNTVSESTVSNAELSEHFRGSLSSGERAQWVPLSLLVGVPKRTHRVFFRRAHRVCRKTRWGSVSSLLLKQYSRNSIPPVSYLEDCNLLK